MTVQRAFVALGALAVSALAAAATIDGLDVTRERGRYSLAAEAIPYILVRAFLVIFNFLHLIF